MRAGAIETAGYMTRRGGHPACVGMRTMALLLPVLLSGAALADGEASPAGDAAWPAQVEAAPQKRDLEFSASIGVMNGEAYEYVYDSSNGRTVSRLDWDFENVSMFTAGAAWAPSEWFRFALKGSTNLSTASKMADYDWNIGDCPPDGDGGDFCESFHEGTRRVSAHMLDASVRCHCFARGCVAIAPVAGSQWGCVSGRAVTGV